MKSSRVLTVAVIVLLVAGLATPAYAITYGEPDAGRHPNVGALVIIRDGHVFQFCTGTLITPTLVVTAEHCLQGGDETQTWVTFDERADDSSTLIPVTFHENPDYILRENDPHDVALVELAEAQPMTPARLPSAGYFTRLNKRGALQGRTFTAVGYGLQEPTHEPGQGAPTFGEAQDRLLATTTFTTLTRAWLKLSQNPATGDGGTCSGDSGGPNFFGGPSSDLIAALTVTGDPFCRSTNVTYRLDTPAARSFLDDFVTLP